MSSRNMDEVSNAVDALFADMGLDKVAADAGAQDPGTSHPAEQTNEKANIQPAVEGARSAENDADNKAEVTGESVTQAPASAADNSGGKSGTENMTDATYVGEDPSVENDYDSGAKDPGTTHPADISKDGEKYASVAEDMLSKVAEVRENGLAEYSDYVGTIVNSMRPKDGEKTASDEDLQKQAEEAITEVVTERVKSAALFGELVGDYLDGQVAVLQKQANEEQAIMETAQELGVSPEEVMAALQEEQGGEMAPEAGAAGAGGGDPIEQAIMEVSQETGLPPEQVIAALEAEQGGAGGEAGGEGGEVEQAIIETAQELGVSPEEVVMALQEEQGGGEAPAEEAPAEEAPAEEAPVEDPEKVAADNKAVEELIQKAAAYDEITASIEAQEQQEAIANRVVAALQRTTVK